jgi:hypothetical protein
VVLAVLLLSALGCRHFPPSFYPIGIYGVPSTNDLAVVRAAGFNLVAGSANSSYLNAARDLGLKVLASPHTSAGNSFNSTAARQAIVKFDAHPALWAWYLVDEPDLNLVAPESVVNAHRFFKRQHARKPTALVIYKGSEALHYANITDLLMVDRYPIPWLPLASFGQHMRQARLALGPNRPLIAVVQAFDWSYYPELVPGEKNLRPPTYAELRCMTYSALGQRANGLFYYSFNDGRWSIRKHPACWEALQAVVQEVNRRRPLFQAEHRWWPYVHNFRDWENRFNAALESSVAPALLLVKKGNQHVASGDYLLAVNTTDKTHVYSIMLPYPQAGTVAVLEENRSLQVRNYWLEDEFTPYAVHVYGPLARE